MEKYSENQYDFEELRNRFLYKINNALHYRNLFFQSNEINHLESALNSLIDLLNDPDSKQVPADVRSGLCNEVAVSFLLRYLHYKNYEDLHNAINMSAESVWYAPENSNLRVLRLYISSIVYFLRFKLNANIYDLFIAKQNCQQAGRNLNTLDESLRIHLLANISKLIFMIYDQLMERDLLNKFINIFEHEVLVIGVDKLNCNNNWMVLIDILVQMNLRNIEVDSIIIHRYLNYPSLHTECRINLLLILSECYRKQYEREECCIAILENAIKYAKQGYILTNREFRSFRLPYIKQLSYLLGLQYGIAGNIDHCVSAINFYREAVSQLKQNGNISEEPELMINYARTLSQKSIHMGTLEDLDEAFEILQIVSETRLTENENEVKLKNNYGIVYRLRYLRNNDENDLLKAIEYFKDANAIVPDKSKLKLELLNNLANAFFMKYEVTKNTDELKSSTKKYQEALMLTKEYDVEFPVILKHIGMNLHSMYKKSQKINDLNGSLRYLGKALKKIDKSKTLYFSILYDIAMVLSDKFNRFKRDADLNNALNIFRKVAAAIDCPEIAIGAANEWSQWALQGSRYNETIEAATLGLDRFNKLILDQTKDKHKELWLQMPIRLASHASFAYAKLNNLEKALEVIESNRALMVSEMCGRKIRDYLKKSVISDIESAADNPIVYIVMTDVGGMAIITFKLNNKIAIKVIFLKDISTDRLNSRLDKYIKNYFKSESSRKMSLIQWLEDLDKICFWLWHSLMGPIITYLVTLQVDFMQNGKSSFKNVTLIPTGFLGLLPLHSAWHKHHDSPNGRRYALEYFNFTISPNSFMMNNVKQSLHKVTIDKLLLVVEPKPNNGSELVFAKEEAHAIEKYWSPDKQTNIWYESASHEEICSQLSHHSVFHFIGHASTDLVNANESGLSMANNLKLTIEHVNKMKVLGRLAILSACETGIQLLKAPEEVISLPTALLGAGFCGVIASLWKVPDSTTALLMGKFYKIWRSGDKHIEPSEALRRAQLEMCKENDTHLYCWAAFVYYGI